MKKRAKKIVNEDTKRKCRGCKQPKNLSIRVSYLTIETLVREIAKIFVNHGRTMYGSKENSQKMCHFV